MTIAKGDPFSSTKSNPVRNYHHQPARCLTGGGRSDDEPKIISGGNAYSGCLAWIEDGLTAPDAGIGTIAEECADADLKIEEIANIWAECDGGNDQPTKERVECRLRQGEGCTGDLASVDFKTGYVWSKTGFDVIKVRVDASKAVNTEDAGGYSFDECIHVY